MQVHVRQEMNKAVHFIYELCDSIIGHLPNTNAVGYSEPADLNRMVKIQF